MRPPSGHVEKKERKVGPPGMSRVREDKHTKGYYFAELLVAGESLSKKKKVVGTAGAAELSSF